MTEAVSPHDTRLRSALFLAHCNAAAMNAGKVGISHNPLAVNWAQWLTFFRYSIPQAHWLQVGRANAQLDYVQNEIDASWEGLDKNFAALWRDAFGPDFYTII